MYKSNQKERQEWIKQQQKHMQELKDKIHEIEQGIQKQIDRDKPRVWEVVVKPPRRKKTWDGKGRNHTYYYIKDSKYVGNLFQVYGPKEHAEKMAYMACQLPQMMNLLQDLKESCYCVDKVPMDKWDLFSEFTKRAQKILESTEPKTTKHPEQKWNTYAEGEKH